MDYSILSRSPIDTYPRLLLRLQGLQPLQIKLNRTYPSPFIHRLCFGDNQHKLDQASSATMTKYMSKQQIDDAGSRKRKEDNYLAKKRSKSIGAEPNRREINDAKHPTEATKTLTIPTQTAPEVPNPVSDRGELESVLQEANIPFKTQLRIVTTVQFWLEEALFDFFQKWLPNILATKGIDMPEKVELTEWTNVMGKEIKSLPKAATQRISGTSLTQELTATYQLRNVALKRQQLSSARLLELLSAASNLVTIIKDDKKIALLEGLTSEINGGSQLIHKKQGEVKSALVRDLDALEVGIMELTALKQKCIQAAKAACEENHKDWGAALNFILDGDKKDSTITRPRKIVEAVEPSTTTESQQGLALQLIPPLSSNGLSLKVIEEDDSTMTPRNRFYQTTANHTGHRSEEKHPLKGRYKAGGSTHSILSALRTVYYIENKDNVHHPIHAHENTTSPPQLSSLSTSLKETLKASQIEKNSSTRRASGATTTGRGNLQSWDITGLRQHADPTKQTAVSRAAADALLGKSTDTAVNSVISLEENPTSSPPMFKFTPASTNALPPSELPTEGHPTSGKRFGGSGNHHPIASSPYFSNASANTANALPKDVTKSMDEKVQRAHPFASHEQPGSTVTSSNGSKAPHAPFDFKALIPSDSSPSRPFTFRPSSNRTSSPPNPFIFPQATSSSPTKALVPISTTLPFRPGLSPKEPPPPILNDLGPCTGVNGAPFTSFFIMDQSSFWNPHQLLEYELLNTQSITFMLGYRDWSFEVCTTIHTRLR